MRDESQVEKYQQFTRNFQLIYYQEKIFMITRHFKIRIYNKQDDPGINHPQL